MGLITQKHWLSFITDVINGLVAFKVQKLNILNFAPGGTVFPIF